MTVALPAFTLLVEPANVACSPAAAPPALGSAGFRDPARPFKARDGSWYMVVGGGEKGKQGHGLLFKAKDATLEHFEFVSSILTDNRTVGFGANKGFFDSECDPVCV